MNQDELFAFLDQKINQYNQPLYIDSDPIQIPHSYHGLQDIEISAFFSASIAWGNRKSIIKDAKKMMAFMGDSPFDFIMNANLSTLAKKEAFSIHRTFNSEDFLFFIHQFRQIYNQHSSLEDLFLVEEHEPNLYHALDRFRTSFLGETKNRSFKHVSSAYKNSACKRLMMFLRWMVRKDQRGVDFGLWQRIPMSKLSCPLDVHSGRNAREMGLLTRAKDDWKAVEELDFVLRKYRPQDPAAYDFALFGLGVFEAL